MRLSHSLDWIDPSDHRDWQCSHPATDNGHTTLYVLYSADPDDGGGVLYVGITGSVRRRFKQHRKAKHWWPEAAVASLECYDSWDAACEAERSRILTLAPIHNVVHSERAGLPTCWVCGGVIFPPPGGLAPDEEAQEEHSYCSDAVVTVAEQEWQRGYQQGQVAHLPLDHPERIAVTEYWRTGPTVQEALVRVREYNR